jgi:hypothetical protein
MSLRVLDPTYEEDVATAGGPARLPSLAGRTVGLLDNGKIRVRELLDAMEELLRAQCGVARVLRLRKPDASRPAPPAIIAELRRCDALIAAVGD